MTSSRAEDRQNAARALSYVQDPSALPFFREVLSATGEQDAILFTGLTRLKDSAARSLLSEMAQSEKEERAALGRNALQRMARVPR
jgi:hypothetical protein